MSSIAEEIYQQLLDLGLSEEIETQKLYIIIERKLGNYIIGVKMVDRKN